MLRTVAVVVLFLAVVGGFVRALSFADNPREGSRPPAPTPVATAAPALSATPTATPALGPGAVAVTATSDRVIVRPRSVRREDGQVELRVDNRVGHLAEVVIARGRPARLAASAAALERARKGIVLLGTAEQSATTVTIPAGRYVVAVRPLTEGAGPPGAALALTPLRVR